MARKYTVKSSSRRWSLQIFFNILDLAAINSWILYNETTGIQIQRKQFLFQLAEQLSSDYKGSRLKRAAENEAHKHQIYLQKDEKFVKYGFVTITKQIINVKGVISMFAENVHTERLPFSFA